MQAAKGGKWEEEAEGEEEEGKFRVWPRRKKVSGERGILVIHLDSTRGG